MKERGEFDPFAPRGWRTITRRFAEMVPSGKLSRLLDIGCGTGQSRQIYEDRTTGYVGIDLSFEALSVALRKFSAADWGQADACRLPFTDCSFDAVAFSSVLDYIPDFLPALSEARRVLTPNAADWIFERIGLGRWLGTFILTAGRKAVEARRA